MMKPPNTRRSRHHLLAERRVVVGFVVTGFCVVAGACGGDSGTMMRLSLRDGNDAVEVTLYECSEASPPDAHGPVVPMSNPSGSAEIVSVVLLDSYPTELLDLGQRECVEVSVEALDAEPTTKVAIARGFIVDSTWHGPELEVESWDGEPLGWRIDTASVGTARFAANVELNPLFGITAFDSRELSSLGYEYCVPGCVADFGYSYSEVECTVYVETEPVDGETFFELQEIEPCIYDRAEPASICYVGYLTDSCINYAFRFYDELGSPVQLRDTVATAECWYSEDPETDCP